MRQPDKIFQGTVPGPLRDFITPALAHLNKQGYKRVVNPACGQMTLLKCAVEAGFKPADCEVSDIGFYSTVLGHFYSGKPIDDIGFTLATEVEVAVYDLLGRKIASLLSGNQAAGQYTLEWNGRDANGVGVPTGMYFLRMSSDEFNATQKIMLMK